LLSNNKASELRLAQRTLAVVLLVYTNLQFSSELVSIGGF